MRPPPRPAATSVPVRRPASGPHPARMLGLATPPLRPAPDDPTAMTRLLAALLAVFFLGLAALMASVTLFVREPMPVLSARVPVSFEHGDRAAGGVRATVSVDPSYRFEITGEVARSGAVPPLALRRGEADGSPVPLDVSSSGAGLFQAHGQFTAPGRWTLEIGEGPDSHSFGFILQE